MWSLLAPPIIHWGLEVIVMKRISPKGVWKPEVFVHATSNGSVLITSGQTGRDVEGKIVSDSFSEQARQALQNLKTIVESQGRTMDDVMKLIARNRIFLDLRRT